MSNPYASKTVPFTDVASDFQKLATIPEALKDTYIDYGSTDFASLRESLIKYIDAVYPTEYNNFIESRVELVLNAEPSVIKTFNTVNYEGSDAHITLPVDISQVTVNNAPAWKSSSDTKGWKCSNIITNLSTGSVKEFIEKEGKWFGYINGNTLNTPLDTSRFSVQGVGVVATVSETPITT